MTSRCPFAVAVRAAPRPRRHPVGRVAGALLAAGLAALAGCAADGPLAGGEPVPEWIATPPLDDGWIYGVGSAGRTWDDNPATAETIAKERARVDLAANVRVHVRAESLLYDTESSSDLEVDIREFVEEDLEQVQTVEIWRDETGRAGKAGQTWVLLRIAADDARRLAASRP